MQETLKAVQQLAPGNLVDLSSCPFLKNHPSAESEYALVVDVERETEECVAVTYEGCQHLQKT